MSSTAPGGDGQAFAQMMRVPPPRTCPPPPPVGSFFYAEGYAVSQSHHSFADLDLCSRTSPCDTCTKFNKQPCWDTLCTDETPCAVCTTVPPEYRRHRCYAWVPIPNYVLRDGRFFCEQYVVRATRDLWTAVQTVPWDAHTQLHYNMGTLPHDVVRLDPAPGPGLLYETTASAVRAHNIRVFCEDKPYSQLFRYDNPPISTHWLYGCCLIPADGSAGPVVGAQLPPPPTAHPVDYVWSREWVRTTWADRAKKQRVEGPVPLAQRPFLPSRKVGIGAQAPQEGWEQ